MKTNSNENENRLNQYVEMLNGITVGKCEIVNKEYVDIPSINFYKYVAKDKLRPVLEAVYYNNGYKVASDGLILVATEESYADEMEGKIVAEDGTFVAGRYPSWQGLFPKDDEVEPVKIDVNEVFNFCKKARAEIKADKSLKMQDYHVKLRDKFFALHMFVKLAEVMRAARTAFVNVPNGCPGLKPVFVHNGPVKALLMPLAIDDLPESSEHLLVL